MIISIWVNETICPREKTETIISRIEMISCFSAQVSTRLSCLYLKLWDLTQKLLLCLLLGEFTNQCGVSLLPDQTGLLANFFGLCKRNSWLTLWPCFEEYRADHVLITVNMIELLGRRLYEHLTSQLIELVQILTLCQNCLSVLLFNFFLFLLMLQSHHLNTGRSPTEFVIRIEIWEVIRWRATIIEWVITFIWRFRLFANLKVQPWTSFTSSTFLHDAQPR